MSNFELRNRYRVSDDRKQSNVDDFALVSVLLTLHVLLSCFTASRYVSFVDFERVIVDCLDMPLLHLNFFNWRK